MDEKDFVSFETANRLKTAGFDELCNYYYTSEDTPKEHTWLTGSSELANFNEIATNNCPIKCSAPMLWQAAKWLREEKEIEVSVAWCRRRKSYYYWYGELSCTDEDVKFGYDFLSYEAALSAGIDAALNLIIEQK